MDRPNSKRTFTKFQRHIDNSGEKVSAVDINRVQVGVNLAEDSIAQLKNAQFMDKVMFEFNNNLFVNSVFTDDYCDLRNIDTVRSKNIEHNTFEQYISNSDSSINAEIYTTKIKSTLGEGVLLNDFFLTTDVHCPHGSGMQHFIITNKNEIYPIYANSVKTPCNFAEPITSCTVKTILIPNEKGECPKLYSMAVMFFDYGVESQYGLLDPDIARFKQSTFATTTLIRDRALEDKLVKVIENGSITDLTYQDDGRLKIVETTSSKDGVKVEEELNYGDYLNSNNEIEDVLLSITTTQETTTPASLYSLQKGDES